MVVTEVTVEEAALEWFQSLGYQMLFGPEFAPGEPAAERGSFQDAVLHERLQNSVARLNPRLPIEARAEAIRKLRRNEQPTLIAENQRIHRLLVEGVPVEYRDASEEVRYDSVQVIDFDNPQNNDWLVVN